MQTEISTTPPIAADITPVGYVGLGIMGAPMVRNLLRAGVPVHVWARRPEQATALESAGASVYATLADLVPTVRVLFLNVSDTIDVQQIVTDAVLPHAQPGLIVVDHSTIDPMLTRQLAQQAAAQGVSLVDAPVSGGEAGAIAGRLTIMLGGEEGAITRILPLLRCVGQTITHVGASGAGQIAKACNQLVIGEALVALSEAYALAEAAGVDPAKVRAALLGGFAYSRVLETHGQRMLDQDYKPGFMARLHAKDMGIVAHTAEQFGLDLSGVARVRQALDQACADGHALDDSTILTRYVSVQSDD